MSDLIIYKDLLIDLFNLSDADIHSIRHENQNGKTVPASFVIAPDAMSVLSAVQLIMKGILLSSTV